MKVLLNIFAFMSIVITASISTYAQNITYKTNQIRDLALIYQGGSQRIDWTVDQFIPYVTHTFADGKKDWLFDGFLFLEFADADKYDFTPGNAKANARKKEWQWLINRIFEKGKAIDALDKCIESQKKIIGMPKFKHKIVLALPSPIPNQKNWGSIDGDSLDFSEIKDQIKAVKWYVDQLSSKFNDENYKNLEIVGFYWLDEDMGVYKPVTQSIGKYINSMKKEFYWIPYWNAPGSAQWKEWGFDIAYQQPNHFFDKNIPDSRLDDACQFGLKNGMAMEFECDSKALFNNKNSSYDRMLSYIKAFEKYDVFKTSAIAYYTGSKGIIDLFNSKSPQDIEIMDILARHIITRRSIKSLSK